MGLADIGNSQVILGSILNWTRGQPFLTQKLCQLAVDATQNTTNETSIIPAGTETSWIESVVKKYIISDWESQDEPEHFKTIRNRLLHNQQLLGRKLGIYQQLLEGVKVRLDDSREQTELLLSGLVIKQQRELKIANPIYQEIFNLEWVVKQLNRLRPYAQVFDAWVASHQQDQSRLLRGQALKDAQIWTQGKSLSNLDYKFLAASQELDRQELQKALEAERIKEVEARLAEEQKRLVQERKANRLLKILAFGMTIKFLLALGWGVTSYLQYQRVLKSEQLAKTCLQTNSPKKIVPKLKVK